MNLLLVFALIAGLVFPASNVSAAGKQKKRNKESAGCICNSF